MSTGTRGGVSEVCDEEMEEHTEMEEDSTSNVAMLEATGTFIVGTTDGTVAEARHDTKRQRTVVNVSADFLNRHISGLWVGLSRTRQKCCVVFLQEIRFQTDQGSRCPTKSLPQNPHSPRVASVAAPAPTAGIFADIHYRPVTSSTRLLGQVLLNSLVILGLDAKYPRDSLAANILDVVA
jgi:hypothetical protein